MAKNGKPIDKSGIPTSGSGEKQRSPTKTSHKGSRVEPSHTKNQQDSSTNKPSQKKKGG